MLYSLRIENLFVREYCHEGKPIVEDGRNYGFTCDSPKEYWRTLYSLKREGFDQILNIYRKGIYEPVR
jgi:hypothetical protein